MSWDDYTKAIVEIELPTGPVVIGARGVLAATDVEFPDPQGRTIHIITADNPRGTDQTDELNLQAFDQLRKEVDRAGLMTFTARGGDLAWSHTEASIAIIGLTDDEALTLGKSFGQQAIFAWRPESWNLIDCESGSTWNFTWGAVTGAAASLATRPDFEELTRWAAGPRLSRVSWNEVRDHLKRRLMMDEEWIVEDDNSLVWWPTPLPLRVYVDDEGEYPDGDNLLHVCAETDIAFTEDDSLGIQLVSEHRHRYPMGTLIFEDGWLRLCAAIALNPLGRSVLSAFHESVLIQASVALELAAEWFHMPGLQWRDGDALAHPVSGARSDVDELVRIYGASFRQPSDNPRMAEETAHAWSVARQVLRQTYVRQGWLEGFTNDEVDFYYAEDDHMVELAIGVNPDDWRVEKFGLGLNLWARLLPAGVAFPDEDANSMNIALLRNFNLTALGHITGGEAAQGRGSILNAYLPLNVWAGYYWGATPEHAVEDMAVGVGNVAVAGAAVSRTFRRWFEELAAQADAESETVSG